MTASMLRPVLVVFAGLAFILSLAGCSGESTDASHDVDGGAWAESAREPLAPSAAPQPGVASRPSSTGAVHGNDPGTPHPVAATRSRNEIRSQSAMRPESAWGGERARTATPEYVLYTAPEQIFTAEVPADWQVQTYVDRRQADGTIPWTGYASPDGQIVIRAPDALPGKFMMPNPYVGRYEGQRSGIFAVRAFVPAEQYASEHAQRIAQQLNCTGGRVIEHGSRPDAIQTVRESMPQAALASMTRIRAGETVLECQYGETSLQIFARAVVIAMDNVQGWIGMTSSMIAPTARAEEARRVQQHIEATTTTNRAWAEREFREGQRRAAEASRKAWQAQQRQRRATAATPSSSGIGTSTGSDDAGHRAFINSIHGTQDLNDRFGDTVYGVESYSNYHWQDGQGNIVGTDIDSNPNPLEYERMTPAGGGY